MSTTCLFFKCISGSFHNMLLGLPKKFLINSWQFLSLFASGVICLIMTFRDDHISTFAIQCNVKNIDLYLPWLLAVEAGYSSLYIIFADQRPLKKKSRKTFCLCDLTLYGKKHSPLDFRTLVCCTIVWVCWNSSQTIIQLRLQTPRPPFSGKLPPHKRD